MENKSKLLYIGEGVLRGFFLSLFLILIFMGVSTFYEVSIGIRAACFVVITALSVIYGSIYSTKKIRERGWVIGIIVAALYVIIIYIVAIIAGSRGFALDANDALKVVLAIFVGSLSGMLGINL